VLDFIDKIQDIKEKQDLLLKVYLNTINHSQNPNKSSTSLTKEMARETYSLQKVFNMAKNSSLVR